MDLITEELIAFFDLETVPSGKNGWVIVEFGAILVCPRRFVPVGEPYSTLIRPSTNALVDNFSDRPNGITRQAIANAPKFTEVSDRIYQILHGRVWGGHNIEEFDCPVIKEAFAKSKREAPRCKFCIDTLPLLRQWFGKRAGDFKLATLGNYFGYGEQTHRSLGDVSTTLNVLKHSATVLFLESSFPNLLPEDTWLAPEDISTSSISATLAPFQDGNPKICILHENFPMRVQCRRMKVLYGIENNFNNKRFSFVVVAPSALCHVLDACDDHAQRRFRELGSDSEWLSVVKEGNIGPNIRLRLLVDIDDGIIHWETKIWKDDGYSSMERVEHTEFDDDDLEMLFAPNSYVDAYFSLDTFDYKKKAGIRLVANKLFIHPRRNFQDKRRRCNY